MESKEPEQRKLGVFFCGLEYENLFSALQTCLVRQESFSIYRCLDTYLDTSNNPAGQLQLGELIKQAKAEYSAEALQGQAGWEFVEAFLKLGNAYVKAQRYPLARATYQDGLNLLETVTSVEVSAKAISRCHSDASVGHGGAGTERVRAGEVALPTGARYQSRIQRSLQPSEHLPSVGQGGAGTERV